MIAKKAIRVNIGNRQKILKEFAEKECIILFFTKKILFVVPPVKDMIKLSRFERYWIHLFFNNELPPNYHLTGLIDLLGGRW